MTIKINNPMVKFFALSLAVFIGLGAANNIKAETYYVSENGNDFGTGLAGAPWATLQQAANTVQAGDSVLVSDGTYTGFNITADGTAASPIVFVGNGNNVVLNVRNSATVDIINIEFADYIVIDNFIIYNGGRAGIRAVEGRGIVIKNNTVGPNQVWGLFTGFVYDLQVLNNRMFGSAEQHGIYVSNSRVANDNCVIRGNECYSNAHNGIQFNGDCNEGGDGNLSNNLIENNIVHDNFWKGFSFISMSSSIIQNNLVYNNGIDVGAGGMHFTDEPGCGVPSNDNIVVNNTVLETRIAAIRCTDNATGNIFFNNIAVASSAGETFVDEVGGNSIDPGSNLLLTSSSGLFVNAANHDYHLLSGTGAVDGGTATYLTGTAPSTDFEGTSRPLGNGYDIGAFEYGGVVIPGDNIPPTVALTNPVDGSEATGTITIQANASDNEGVAGVQFKIDGANIGPEDVTPPFETSFNTNYYSNGIYDISATARDASNNTTDSSPISVTINNISTPNAIIQTRPRLYLTPERMALLRSKSCFDQNGNVIPGCTPTEDWLEFKDWIDEGITYASQGWHWALVYMMNRDISYAQEAIDQTMNGIINEPRLGFNKNYLNCNDVIRRVAVVYDWLYDMLTPAQRATMRDYMNMIINELWNPATNPTNTWNGWGTQVPGNNFYYEHMLTTTLAGIALAYDNPNPPTLPHNGVDYTDILEFVDAKWNLQAIPEWLNTHGRGGAWHEGSHYMITAWRKGFEAVSILKDAGGTDYFSTINFPRENAILQIYLVQPRRQVVFPGGDMAMDAAGMINGYDRQTWYLLADGLKGTVESEYLQHVIHNVIVTPSFNYHTVWAHEFLYYDPNLPSRNYNQLPLSYFAPGLGWVHSRSSWNDDAISVTFNSSEKRLGHQHFDQNSFHIYKEEWQAVDPVVYCAGGLISDTGAHNTIIVDGTGQRGNPGCEGDGTGAIIKYEAGPGYTYAVGDASDAYHVNAPYETTSKLNTFLRELVHVKPDVVVVYDRITPIDPNYDIEYRLHSRFAPTVAGDLVTSTHNGGKIFQRTLLPADHVITVVDESNEYRARDPNDQYRIELRPAVNRPNRQFLNVLYAATSSAVTMPAVEHMTSASGNMTGARVSMGVEDAVLMFSTNPGGAPPDGDVMFEIGFNLNSIQYIFDLFPDSYYSVNLVASEDKQMVVIKLDESGFKTSDQGVLIFNAEDIQAAPRELITQR